MVSRVIHFEIPIDDPERAGRFYTDVFGWTVSRWGPVEYWNMTTGAAAGPGAEGALTPRSEAPNGVIVYVGVSDVDDALAKVRAAGGDALGEKQQIPGIGWMARFRDTEGNVIGLFQEQSGAGSDGDSPTP
jgi:predicted enzyme related to lactoylglutathione lyase